MAEVVCEVCIRDVEMLIGGDRHDAREGRVIDSIDPFTGEIALDGGTVWLNCCRAAWFLAPFSGFTRSGLGKENGLEAVGSFTRTRAVWVEFDGQARDPFTVGSRR